MGVDRGLSCGQNGWRDGSKQWLVNDRSVEASATALAGAAVICQCDVFVLHPAA